MTIWYQVVQPKLQSAMAESRAEMGDALPRLIECLGRVATDSSASICNRFDAIELLLRIGLGPRQRCPDRIDAAASRHARIALAEAASFLDRTMNSNNNRARIRLHAASLAGLVTALLTARHRAPIAEGG